MVENKGFTDLMLDVETLGVSPTAPIISVAAVAFNLTDQATAYADQNIDPQFYSVDGVPRVLIFGVSTALFGAIDYRSAISVGSMPEISTLKWWMDQPKDIRETSFGGRWSMDGILYNIQGLVNSHTVGRDRVRVWSKGASFDIPMLRYQYVERLGDDSQPWRHWNEYCTRTVISQAQLSGKDTNIPLFKPTKAHDPISDCLAQIRATISCAKYRPY